MLLSNSPPSKHRNAKERAAAAESHKFYLYDTKQELLARFRVGSFRFSREGGLPGSVTPERPRKVLLSPNKSLLLILGAYHKNRKCLSVYQIFDTQPNPFHLIFYDYAFSFIDACFSPDSRSLVCIPTRHPHHLFVLALPLIECPHNKPYDATSSLFLSATAKKNAEHHVFADSRPSFQPRVAGPVDIVGPSVNALTGQLVAMTHVVSSPDSSEEAFHYMTWGETQGGEYCLWKLKKRARVDSSQASADGAVEVDVNGTGFTFEVCPRSLAPEVTDLQWLANPEGPKLRIVSASFSDASVGKLMVVVRRDRFGKQADNGLGIQSCDVSALNQPGAAFGPWYQVSDSGDVDDLACAKWTQPLLLGKEPSAAAVLKKKGFFELVSHRYGSSFQALNNESFTKCTNFVQVNRFHRYWSNGEELHAFMVTPQATSSHPEWSELCKRGETEALAMRLLGRRIGYLIHEVIPGVTLPALYAAYEARRRGGAGGAKKGGVSRDTLTLPGEEESLPVAHAEPLEGEADEFIGLHLHRCWHCRAVLLKPLLCGRCKAAVYCSSDCAQVDWKANHARVCSIPGKSFPKSLEL